MIQEDGWEPSDCILNAILFDSQKKTRSLSGRTYGTTGGVYMDGMDGRIVHSPSAIWKEKCYIFEAFCKDVFGRQLYILDAADLRPLIGAVIEDVNTLFQEHEIELTFRFGNVCMWQRQNSYLDFNTRGLRFQSYKLKKRSRRKGFSVHINENTRVQCLGLDTQKNPLRVVVDGCAQRFIFVMRQETSVQWCVNQFAQGKL